MATDPPPEQSGAFEVVRRGYARDQVDALVRELERRAQVAENGRRMAEQHAAAMAEDLRVLRAGTPAEGLPAAPQSFGFRAEKVVRLAEREAADLRAAAQRDVDAILEAGMREVAEIRAAATREAAGLLERAHSEAAEARADADAERAAAAASRAESAALRAAAERGGEGLRALRASIRGELARVHGLIGAQLESMDSTETTDTGAEPPAADPPTSAFSAAEGEDPVWTATPGTADLFDTPPRPAPRVPGPRAEASENRHSLRSG